MLQSGSYDYRDEVAERLARFTVSADTRLDEATTRAAKRALSDSVAVALGALDHPASHAARRFAAPLAHGSGCVIWGTGMRANPDLATLVNGSLLRCFDYNDFYVGARNSGHPSDMTSGVVAVAEWVGASGAELLGALAVGYEVVGAVFDAFTTAPGGWDYTNLTGIGAVAAVARLLGLNEDQAREAFGIAVVPHFASDEVESCELNRRGDLTMWKRFNGSDAVRNAVMAGMLAKAGVEGAIRPFVGANGFVAKLKNPVDPLPILSERLADGIMPRRIAETYMKLWPVGSVGQSAIRAALEARAQVADLGRIREVRVYSEEGAFDHLVAIRQDPYRPISRETADHSMPYIVGAAVLDGYVHVDSFDLDRVLDPARQDFVANRVKVFPEPALGTIKSGKLARAKAGYLSRVEIELADGTVAHGAAKPFPGHPDAPFSDADIMEKLGANAERFAGRAAVEEIGAALRGFETIANVRTFTARLAFDWERARTSAAG